MWISDGANGWLDSDEFDDEQNVMHTGDLGFAVSRYLTQDQVKDYGRQSSSPLPENESAEADSQDCQRLSTMPFIVYKEGAYSLAPDAVSKLSQLSNPMCVVTVFGAAGSGKSTLVIRSLYSVDPSSIDFVCTRQENQEKVGDSRSSNDVPTVAFWMWSPPISVPQLGGANINILILESGRGDPNVLFSIAVLLSSHILYNGVGLLDDHRISDLQTVRNLTRFSFHFLISDDN